MGHKARLSPPEAARMYPGWGKAGKSDFRARFNYFLTLSVIEFYFIVSRAFPGEKL
jgi:hypothetical protein